MHDGECYRHATRKVVFLGDFIDRGPFQRDTVRTAMAMVQPRIPALGFQFR